MSRQIASDVIAELGELHYGRKRIQPASRTIREFYERAAEKLKFELVRLSDGDVQLAGESFREVIRSQVYTCHACAIMPDHVHLLIRKHKHRAEEMIENFQQASRAKLLGAMLPEVDHPVWGGPGWKVFLDHPDDIRRTIRYVRNNPIKMRRPERVWDFVREYDGWPVHPGSRMRMSG